MGLFGGKRRLGELEIGSQHSRGGKNGEASIGPLSF